tara:strand:- start:1001 stop:1237 length:237 start_codon:yes stop_codon:yes gene_type:complete
MLSVPQPSDIVISPFVMQLSISFSTIKEVSPYMRSPRELFLSIFNGLPDESFVRFFVLMARGPFSLVFKDKATASSLV